MAESKDMMDGGFSFLNKNNEYHFEFAGSVQGRIARLNGQMARIYFVSGLEEGVSAPSEIQVKDLRLNEFAPMIQPNNNVILTWTSDYNIHYKRQFLVKLKMQQQYSCRAFVRSRWWRLAVFTLATACFGSKKSKDCAHVVVGVGVAFVLPGGVECDLDA
jgi:hypothetical protein